MSIDITIKQKGFFKKHLTLNMISQTIGNDFSFGIMNNVYALEPIEDNDYFDKYLICYRPKQIGRGTSLFLNSQSKDILLNLNIPSTLQDVEDFYLITEKLCQLCKTDFFVQDGNKVKLSEIKEQCESIKNWNNEMLVQFTSDINTPLIFGAVYPIYIEEKMVEQLRTLEPQQAMQNFGEYLHRLQNQDLYYARSTVYQELDSEKLFASYVLTEDVTTVLPLVPSLPIFIADEYEISYWWVYLGRIVEGEYQVVGAVNFEDFAKIANLTQFQPFDQLHVIVTLDSDMIDKLLPYVIKQPTEK